MMYRLVLPMIFTLLACFETAICSTNMPECSEANSSDEDCPEKYELSNPKYKRVIVLSQDTTYADPLLDPNHQLALSMTYKNGEPLYTQAEIDALNANAFEDLFIKYGIDARSITPDALGIRTVPGVGLGLPILIGRQKQFFLVSDSQHPDRDQICSNRWVDVEVDMIFEFTNPYTVPPGFLMAGAQAEPGYLFAYGDLNLLENAAVSNTDLVFSQREILKFTTNWLDVAAPDQWGHLAYTISTRIEDEFHNVGTYISGSPVLRKPPYAVPHTDYTEVRAVITWPFPNQSGY